MEADMPASFLRFLLPWLAALLALPAPVPAAASSRPRALVFAAASLADALEEVGKAYEQTGRGEVAFNFAGSDTLARQIAAGAPADLFVSADLAQVEAVEKAGRAAPSGRLALLGNSLVVVVPAAAAGGELQGPADLFGFDRLALADPEGVPAGVYARRWLAAEGLWQQLAPRVVPALDVRAALAAVAGGNLPAGIVYATDAAVAPRVRVVYRVPPERGPAITYYATLLAGGGEPGPASGFLAFLRGEPAGAIFRRCGFRFLPEAGGGGD
jgi:molybdate transport system substrate-binding protein